MPIKLDRDLVEHTFARAKRVSVGKVLAHADQGQWFLTHGDDVYGVTVEGPRLRFTLAELEPNPAPVLVAREIVGRQVRVHYNLHRCPGGPRGEVKPGEACFVVSEKVGGAWKVIGYVSELLLADVDFKVSAAGVRSIREKKQRAVVAWIIGTVADPKVAGLGTSSGWEGVSFNPFKADTFYLDDGTPVDHAPMASVSGRRAAVKLRSANPGRKGAAMATMPIRSAGDLRYMVDIIGGTFDDEPPARRRR